MNTSAQDPMQASTDELSTGGSLQWLDHGDIITDLSNNSEDTAGLVRLTGNEVALLVDSLAAERGAA